MNRQGKRVIALIMAMIVTLSKILLSGGEVMAKVDEKLICGDFEYIIKNDNTVEIKKYIGDGDGKVVIPEEIDEKKVTGIGGWAFYGCGGLTEIDIPQSVTNMGYCVFHGCSGLTQIYIPAGVTDMGGNPLLGCTGLTSVVVDEKNKKYDSREGCNAIIETSTNTVISGCKNTKIPHGVEKISNNAFLGCSGLTEIFIPQSVSSIGFRAFTGCSSLESIEIDEKNESYDSREDSDAIIETKTSTLILGCKNTKIPSGITGIGDEAFEGCIGLTEIEIPSGVTSVGDSVFCDCSNLTEIKLPKGLVKIGNCMFYNCVSLTGIDIPKTTKSIGYYAFYNGIGLTEINIPASVTSIGSGAFNGCINLTKINIPNGVTSLGSATFCGCTNLTEINIPPSVTSIKDGVFFGCSSLTELKILKNVTCIGERMFEACDNLVVYCNKDSLIHSYVESNDVPYILVDTVLSSITAVKTKTHYRKGEKLNVDDIVVTAEYEEGYTMEAAEYVTNADKLDMSVEGEKILEISYTENGVTKTSNVVITVTEDKEKMEQEIKVTKSYIKDYGDKAFKLNAKLTKGDGKLTYFTSNKKVANVSSEGKVSIIGTGICTITIKASETDDCKKETKKVTINIKPKKSKVTKLKTNGNKSIRVSWKKDLMATGYEIQYSTSKSFAKKTTGFVIVKDNKVTSAKIKRLTKGKKYYVRVRAYKDENIKDENKRIYGEYSDVKKSGKI